MEFISTDIPDVLVIEPNMFGDKRGFLKEIYNVERFAKAGLTQPFLQDNYTRSVKGTLRGLHFQHPRAQGKLVQAVFGSIWDVAVDIRSDSPSFGRWVGVLLSEENGRQLWVPPGFAHGFCVLSEQADIIYKCTDLYAPECEYSISWNDPELNIRWPLENPILSPRDTNAKRLANMAVLPTMACP